MKTLYLDCGMGAAGDMLTAALLELIPAPDAFLRQMNGLGIPGIAIKRVQVARCGIQGTHVVVTVNGKEEMEDVPHGHAHIHEHAHDHEHTHEHEHEHEHEHAHEHECAHGHTHEHIHAHDHGEGHAHHHHSTMAEIEQIVGRMPIPERVKTDVLQVYGHIAQAESHAHGVPVTQIHFHEVGSMDAVADITAVCLLMAQLAPDEVVVSPIHVGSGQVRCAHGILPVPAPATAYILRDVPIYGGQINGELCTPTGAALLVHFATRFGQMPVMRTQKIGYGMGKKEFEAANCVRAMLGESAEDADAVCELACNVDDMTAEEIGFAMERLFEAGALEVYTIAVGMKKSRPGTLLRVLCAPRDREALVRCMFRNTTTIGIRETACDRYVLKRSTTELSTPEGPVRRKDVSGYGVARFKYEYEDLVRIARQKDISIPETIAFVEQAQDN